MNPRGGWSHGCSFAYPCYSEIRISASRLWPVDILVSSWFHIGLLIQLSGWSTYQSSTIDGISPPWFVTLDPLIYLPMHKNSPSTYQDLTVLLLLLLLLRTTSWRANSLEELLFGIQKQGGPLLLAFESRENKEERMPFLSFSTPFLLLRLMICINKKKKPQRTTRDERTLFAVLWIDKRTRGSRRFFLSQRND